MAQLQYFFEDLSALSAEDVARKGCAHVLPRFKKCQLGASGPGGHVGMLAVHSGEHMGYYPERQIWRKRGPGVWVGMWRELPKPTPAELATADPLPGHEVTLRDGQRWVAPMAREWDAVAESSRVRVPAAFDLNDDGQWVRGEVEQPYQRLWDIASKRWETIGDPSASLLLTDATDMAVECLSVNYRLGRVEAALLGLFDDQGRAALEVLDAAVDLPTIRAWMQKKTDRPDDASSTSDGEAA